VTWHQIVPQIVIQPKETVTFVLAQQLVRPPTALCTLIYYSHLNKINELQSK